MNEEIKLKKFQDYISYQFKDINLLKQALTTTQYAKENDVMDYQIFETLGDAIIKLIISLKLYNSGVRDPDILTKQKQCLEDKESFIRIATNMELKNYVISSDFQKIEDTAILADVFESICGAIFLDANWDLKIIEHLIIDRFIEGWEIDFRRSPHFAKNLLLEYLQKRMKITPILKFKHEKVEKNNQIQWRVIGLDILDKQGKIIEAIPKDISTELFSSLKDAEKEMSRKVLNYLRLKSTDL